MPPYQSVLKFWRLLTNRRIEISLVEWSCARVVLGRTKVQETLPYQMFFTPVLQP